MALVDEVETRYPAAIVRRGGVTFLEPFAAAELVELAVERGVRVLGLEGFLVADDAVYPSSERLADFSEASPHDAISAARTLIITTWAHPPSPGDQMAERAMGRHMLVVGLDEA